MRQEETAYGDWPEHRGEMAKNSLVTANDYRIGVGAFFVRALAGSMHLIVSKLPEPASRARPWAVSEATDGKPLRYHARRFGQTLLAAWRAQRNIEDLEAKLREQEAWDAPQAEMNSAP